MWMLVRPDAVKALEDPGVKKALSRYVDVVKNHKYAKFLIAGRIEADYDEDASLQELWQIHNKLVEEYYEIEREIDSGQLSLSDLPQPKKSLLTLKSLIGDRLLEACVLCERRCKVNRFSSRNGYCRAPADMPVSSMFEHLGEEPEIVPSFTVYSC
ncbi:MAG: hypothetical protein DRJ33_04160 [Candidatus Methanomethylicota archaeon]|uniref:Pyruvate formate lyase-activating protein n=1 Tax=Thermoproteota archaeon TaxID=2056631 RepID=A0A497EY27_9CREN|nr:MAG: hypothetical protein DRJ33_04160 [Candidatus Verstraetearchaeota archaeon]